MYNVADILKGCGYYPDRSDTYLERFLRGEISYENTADNIVFYLFNKQTGAEETHEEEYTDHDLDTYHRIAYRNTGIRR